MWRHCVPLKFLELIMHWCNIILKKSWTFKMHVPQYIGDHVWCMPGRLVLKAHLVRECVVVSTITRKTVTFIQSLGTSSFCLLWCLHLAMLSWICSRRSWWNVRIYTITVKGNGKTEPSSLQIKFFYGVVLEVKPSWIGEYFIMFCCSNVHDFVSWVITGTLVMSIWWTWKSRWRQVGRWEW